MTDRSAQLLQRGYRLQEDNVTEPRTEAGRALHRRLDRTPRPYAVATDRGTWEADILEVERQAATLALADVAEPTPEEVSEYRLDAIDPENAALNRAEWEAHKRIEAIQSAFPRGYDHRRGCSRVHPVTFACDDGTPTNAALAAALKGGTR